MSTRSPYSVHRDIRQASTLPGNFYRDPAVYAALQDQVLPRTWQWVGNDRKLFDKATARPLQLLPGSLNEPLLLTRGKDQQVRCLSNVCTHRANLLLSGAQDCRGLSCGYHGRRFDLTGQMLSMPEFDSVADFPAASDNLPQVPTAAWAEQRFVSLDPACSLQALLDPVSRTLGEMPVHEFRYEASLTREYVVGAHWALYVDNYLEGFHIPYVHPELARSVDFQSYDVELFEWASLQRAQPRPGELAFERSYSAADCGKPAAAYYFWLFPNTMLNFYPWGLSVNIVHPLTVDQCKVEFHSFLWRPELLELGAGGSLDKVQREDELVVEGVQAGIRSRLYQRGRYSPKRESAVHHFHRLLSQALQT